MSMNPEALNRVNKTDENHSKMIYVMTAAAWLVLCIGIVMCLVYIRNFSDTNLGLMVGIGFLIGSVQIYIIGCMLHLISNYKY